MKLSVKDLSFSYPENIIFNHLSFSVNEGEFISILGPSGCGKSTLLNVLTGLLSPQNGEILIDGKKAEKQDKHFAYMPQKDLLLPWKTILDNVCLYGEINHTKREMKQKALNQLSLFGLDGCENKFPQELSGGMRQRAAFLRTTMCDADIYLLDEPFGALDIITRGDMQDWLRNLCSSLNKTILLVTHDIDEAIYLSDRILIMGNNGRGIHSEISITEKNRTRDWLYNQGKLRTEIHETIKGQSDDQ